MTENSNVLEYRGYFTAIKFSAEDRLLYGKIEGIEDLMAFEAESADEIEKAFHEAVDYYLELCDRVGKEPNKAFSGRFNLRLDPELHRAAHIQASLSNMSLNSFIVKAVENIIEHNGDTHNHNTQVIVYSQAPISSQDSFFTQGSNVPMFSIEGGFSNDPFIFSRN